MAEERDRPSNRKYHLLVILFILVLMITYMAPRIFYFILPGEAGVLYRPFENGTVMETFDEGLHLVFPANRMYVYNVRIQEKLETVDVLSFNGLMIHVTVSYRFRPIYEDLPKLHKEIGPEYIRKVVTPTVYAAVREIVGKYRPEELYTSHRLTVQEEIIRNAREAVEGKYIVFDAILIRTMKLPTLINAAIERKLRQQQEFQEYEFRLAKEEREAERKRIEARGIRDFQMTISEHLPKEILVWRGIQATLELARSNNAKIIAIGGNNDGLSFPLVMGNLDAPGIPDTQTGATGATDGATDLWGTTFDKGMNPDAAGDAGTAKTETATDASAPTSNENGASAEDTP